MADCVTMLTMVLHSQARVAAVLGEHDVIAACVQALETEHAARIQATAARQTGFMTMVAGGGAILAAGIAYAAVVRGLRPAEIEKEAALKAYKTYLVLELLAVEQELYQCLITLERNSRTGVVSLLAREFLEKTTALTKKADPKNWQVYARLSFATQSYIDVHFLINLTLMDWATAKRVLTDTTLDDREWAALRAEHYLSIKDHTINTTAAIRKAQAIVRPKDQIDNRIVAALKKVPAYLRRLKVISK